MIEQVKLSGQAHKLQEKSNSIENEHLIPDAYKKIAEGVQSQFIQIMINQMKKTVDKSKKESSAEQFYNSILDSERAGIMSQREDVTGLKKAVLDQIYPTRMRTKYAFKAYKNRQHDLPRQNSIILNKQVSGRNPITVKETINTDSIIIEPQNNTKITIGAGPKLTPSIAPTKGGIDHE